MAVLFENLILGILCLFCLCIVLLLMFVLALIVVKGAKKIKEEVQKHDRTE